MTVSRRKTQWSGVEYDPFSISSHGDNEESTNKPANSDEKDPFGDFVSNSSNNGTSQHWEDGFASNFADMDLSNMKISSTDKRTENTANA